MSAEVETMFYSGQTPWHGLGEYVGEEPIFSEEALVRAGLNWDVAVRPVFCQTTENSYQMTKINDTNAIVRTTDKSILGVVGTRYTPIQNKDSFKFMDSLVEEGEMRYHTAGSLRNGQKVWILGKIGTADVVPGDAVDKFLLLYNTHDGSRALRCLFTPVRVVCANTARLALDGHEKEGISIRHTSNAMLNIEKSKEILGLARRELDNFIDFSKYLARRQMNEDAVNDFIKAILPNPPEDTRSTYVENQREKIVELFESGVGQNLPLVAGTGWAAYNAVVEFANYFKSAKGKNPQERRFESTLFGTGANLIDKAVNYLKVA